AESPTSQHGADACRSRGDVGRQQSTTLDRAAAPMLVLVRILARQAARDVDAHRSGDDHA
ncbi:MAG: hypothetical protein Q7U75_00675, partial [Desulfobacterales bacterium]|nr:hypothetical protein [Desulfobacterales bacterium]